MRLRVPNNASLEERFNFYLKINDLNSCWIWSGPKIKTGYGVIGYRENGNRQRIYAHRLSWILSHGEIVPGIQVLHHCDNPPCCNPEHLFLGTQADNMHDMKLKGRRMGVETMPRGTEHYRTTLLDENIVDIRRRAKIGESLSIIARDFGLTTGAIWRIVKRQNWKHIA